MMNSNENEQQQKWGYDKACEDWALHYEACNGVKQSPIDVVDSNLTTTNMPRVTVHGVCRAFQILSDDTNYKWKAQDSICHAIYEDKKYLLDHFHFHMPSEHQLNGTLFDGELHLVHIEATSGDILVIGIFLNAMEDTSDHPWFQTILESLNNTQEEVSIMSDVYANIHDGFFRYDGSLTTPPCSEIVDWWVNKTPMNISISQAQAFSNKLKLLKGTKNGQNSRPIQPIHDRKVYSIN